MAKRFANNKINFNTAIRRERLIGTQRRGENASCIEIGGL